MKVRRYLQKHCELEYPKLTVISIVVLIGGSILLGIGYDMIFGETVEKLKSDLKEAKKTVRVYDVSQPLTFDITPTYGNDTLPVKSILLTLEKDIIFARDTVKIKAEAKGVDDDILEIALILNDGTIYFKKGTPRTEINFERDYARQYNLLLELNQATNPPFVDEINPKFSKPDLTFHVTGSILFKNGTIAVVQNSDGLFTIYSKINKLQVDTNKAILEQTDIIEINNIQQEITNQIFLGLTVIGIAVIPIVGGFDVLIRIYLDKKQLILPNKKNIDKIEPWNCDWFKNNTD